jgi:CBS domain-containing protein
MALAHARPSPPGDPALARRWNDRRLMPENTRRDRPVSGGSRREGRWDDWGVGPVHGAATRGRGWWQGEPLTAADIMTANVSVVPRHMPVTQMAELMRRESIGVVPVVDLEDALVGIVTDRDIVVRGCVASRPLVEQTAADVMTTDVECARSDETLVNVVERMAKRGVRRLPVLDAHRRRDHKVIGIVALDDIEAHATEDLALSEALQKYARKRRRHPVAAPRPERRESFLPALWRRLRG